MTCEDMAAALSPSLAQIFSSNSGVRCANVPTAPENLPTRISSAARLKRSISRCTSEYQFASLNPNVIGSACTPGACNVESLEAPYAMLSRETKDSKCRALFPASRRHRSRRPPADYFVRKNAVISWSIRHAPAGPGASQRELQRRCIKRRVLLQEEFAGTRLRLGMTLKKHPDGVRHGLVERRYGECRKPVAAAFNLVKTQLLATGALRLDSGHGCLLPAL